MTDSRIDAIEARLRSSEIADAKDEIRWETQMRWNGEIEKRLEKVGNQLASLKTSYVKLLLLVAGTSGSTIGVSKIIGLLG